MQLFHTCTTFLLPKIVTFRTWRKNQKLFILLKQKKVTFRDRNLQKVENDQNLPHFAFVLATQMKTTFLCPHAGNLAQTNGFIAVLLPLRS